MRCFSFCDRLALFGRVVGVGGGDDDSKRGDWDLQKGARCAGFGTVRRVLVTGRRGAETRGAREKSLAMAKRTMADDQTQEKEIDRTLVRVRLLNFLIIASPQ